MRIFVFVKWHNLETFAAPMKGRYYQYVSVSAVLGKLKGEPHGVRAVTFNVCVLF